MNLGESLRIDYLLKYLQKTKDIFNTEVFLRRIQTDDPILKERLNLILSFSEFLKKNEEIDNINLFFIDLTYSSDTVNWAKTVFDSELFNTEEEVDQFCKILSKKNKEYYLLKDENIVRNIETIFKELSDPLIDFKNNDNIIKLFDELNSTLNLKLEDIKKEDGDDKLEFDFSNFDDIFEDMVEYVSKTSVIKTGFKKLDESMPAGGLEKRRLYVIGGSSGVGKSTALINFLCNFIKNYDGDKKEKKIIFYFTAENLITETYERLICCYYNIPIVKLTKELKHISKLKVEGNEEKYNEEKVKFYNKYFSPFKKVLEDKGIKLKIIYYEPDVTNVEKLEQEVRKYIGEYKIHSVFVDYLSLFISGKKLEKRHELAYVTQKLKNISVKYDCPVITASQLNREGYDLKKDPKLTQISESMEIVNKADFVLFLQTDEKNEFIENNNIIYRRIRATLLKNRNGKRGFGMLFEQKIKNSKTNESMFSYRIFESNTEEDEYDLERLSASRFEEETGEESENNVKTVNSEENLDDLFKDF